MATGPDDYRPKCNISTRCNVSTVRLNCSYGYTPCASFSSSHIPGALALATPTTASCITENERTKSASWITEGTKQHGRGRVKTAGRKQTSHWHLHSNLAPSLKLSTPSIMINPHPPARPVTLFPPRRRRSTWPGCWHRPVTCVRTSTWPGYWHRSVTCGGRRLRRRLALSGTRPRTGPCR